MKRIYLIMLMIVAMMVSCNPKDDDENQGGNGNNGGGGITGVYNPEKKISKITWQSVSYSDREHSEDWNWYSDRLQNIIDEDGYQYDFYYNSNGMIETYADDEGEKWIFEYKGNVLSEIHYYYEDYCYFINKLQYSNGKVSKVERIWYPYDEDTYSYVFNIKWNGANVSEVSMYESDTDYYTYTYEYDDKKNPFYNYMGIPPMSLYALDNIIVLSVNNITKTIVEVGPGYNDGEHDAQTIINVYEYDKDGYPVALQKTINGAAADYGAATISFNIEYLNDGNNGGNEGGDDNGDNYDPDGEIAGHGYVDLGLPSGLKWATCNVGASSPEDYGDYFAWGETSPKAEYTSENSITYEEQMSDISGNAQYDAATANWGGSWRMPTKDEMQELIDNCTWELTQVNGVNGSEVIGPNGSCIFLPAAGSRNGSSLGYGGYYGNYWSSTPCDDGFDNSAYSLHFYDGGEYVHWYSSRPSGLTVRPITE